MKNVLVAGASGNLGKYVVTALKERGFCVTALTRKKNRLQEIEPYYERAFVADATDANALRGACTEIDVAVSCLGGSVNPSLSGGRQSFQDVDFHANMNLLKEAASQSVKKFIYVGVYGHEVYGELNYVKAHELFAKELTASNIPSTIVRPTGFFSSFGELFKMAKMGRAIVFGDGEVRTNPIHEDDLAHVCVDAINQDVREINVGGPEIFTRRQAVELAFKALDKTPRISHLPIGLLQTFSKIAKPFNKRISEILAFFAKISEVDVVAPKQGERTLRAYFQQLAEQA